MAKIRADAEKPSPLAGLTDQERVVLDLIGEGLTNLPVLDAMFLRNATPLP